MDQLVLTLQGKKRDNQKGGLVVGSDADRISTQFFLKQSCEQKKLSLPIFWQVGHCSVLASFGQSVPMHFRVMAEAVKCELHGCW